jgi:membrane fusion protein, multidrug efflux system
MLWPGQYVDVEVDLAVMPNTATVPTVAIQSGQRAPYVFVAKADQSVEMRNVELAGAEGARTAISSGLNSGERIVVQGQLRLSPGAHWYEAEPVPGANPAGPSDKHRPQAAVKTSKP